MFSTFTTSLKMQIYFRKLVCLLLLFLVACTPTRDREQFTASLDSLGLSRGEITLCGSGAEAFGSVDFSQACADEVRDDFNLATALLHSFEYTEAEKVFARVIEKDPQCLMAYWGAAMSNFHPLWAPPSPAELKKGSGIIRLARQIDDAPGLQREYLNAIAAFYEQWQELDHRTRVQKFAEASRQLYEKFPDDREAAIFYALALNAAADPADKTFKNQKKAGQILDALFAKYPAHPGIAHYIIHNYDYPELAASGLPAARKYASIAAASAHAQHMPSHIFTRLGLWEESIDANAKSVSAAQCYAESSGMKGHWDEELHGIDYLVYAYLQNGNDDEALKQVEYLRSIEEVSPMNFKVAYCFAAAPARYAVERKDWKAAANLELHPATFPWEKYAWESGNLYFSRALGNIHTKQLPKAKSDLAKLQELHTKLVAENEKYKANLILIQVKIIDGWVQFAEGNKGKGIQLLTEAADLEDATSKHPVTPGEIIPARELLADMYLAAGDYEKAISAYRDDLTRHPGRFNALYGAARASEKAGDRKSANMFFEQLVTVAGKSPANRPELTEAKAFLNMHH